MQFTKRFLDEQRLHGDKEADEFIEAIFSEGKQAALYELLKLEPKEIKKQAGSAIKEFLISQKTRPGWFDAKRLQNGQHLFKHYALEMMALLGVMSLPYCYAASPGNKALYLSDKMRNSPGKRLLDTASFVIEVMTPGNLDEEKAGPIHINKVRVIHALSRYHLTRLPQWDTNWGLPINQEDMAGTNLAFSYVILLGMQQSGFILSQKDKEDFLFAWRYIGYLLHINEALLPTSFNEARHLALLIKTRNFKKTEEGTILTSELLRYYKTSVSSWQAELIGSQVRFYLGNEVAEYIGLSRDTVRDKITSSINTFQSLQNMTTTKPSSYQKMLFQHRLLQEKFVERKSLRNSKK